jgi:two-component system, NarL family, response regulator NreC
MVSIVLVDDHQIVRQGLKVLLEAEPEFQVVGEASDGQQAVELVRQVLPDVLVVDLNLPSLNGIEVVQQVKAFHPTIRAIVLSMHSSEDYVLPAFASGASGYVLKDSAVEDLVYAIHQAFSGNRYLSPQLAEKAIDSYLHAGRNNSASDLFETLTQRERQVIQLSVEGLSYGEIASRLVISPRTAETHRNNAMRKLGISNTPELVRYAIKHGLISVD